MSLFVPPRRPSHERLDDPDLPSDEMRRSLEDIDLVHRRWRGSRVLVRHLAPRIRALGRPASILDVGAGSGTVARRLRIALGREGGEARVVALDVQWRHLAAGRALCENSPPPAVAADAFRLPFADGAFDFGVSTLFLHHFGPAEIARILGEISRTARHGFALLDLRRHRVAALWIGLAGRLLFQARVSVEDGVASIRQAYTPEELLAIVRPLAPGSCATRVFPFGLLVTDGP